MNRTDVNKIMAILEVAYPNWIAKLEDEKLKIMLNMWTELFADDDANLVASAIKAIVLTDPSPFPPTIGAIKSKMFELSNPNELTEQEAWNLVYKAISNSGHNSKEEHDKLPEVIKSLLTPQMLREYAMMDSDQIQSVVASNFMRSYRTRKEKFKEFQLLPNNMKTMISNLANQLQIGAAGKEE